MAVTTLDPRTALVVIDLQKGVVSLPSAHTIAEVVKQAAMLADAFRARALPVVLSMSPARPRAAPSRRLACANFPSAGRISFPN